MSDSENESRTTAVGRKRIRTGESGSYATPVVVSSAASSSGSESSSKESGEISSSSSGSRRSSHQSHEQPQDPQESDSDQDDESDSGSSDTDGSMETDDSDEESPAHAMGSPEGENAQHDGATNRKSQEGKDDFIRIEDLSDDDQDEQYHYFGLDYDDDVVICFCCGERGHMRATCPERTCTHCGAFDSHASHACPQYRKCARCRLRGHDSVNCTNSSTLPPGIIDTCDICGETGHVEEECVKLWDTSKEPVTMRPVRRIWADCYNCGINSHWGDDCPRQRYSMITSAPKQIQTWSARHAGMYVNPEVEISEDENESDKGEDGDEDERDERAESEEGEVKEDSPPPARNWQTGLFDDSRD